MTIQSLFINGLSGMVSLGQSRIKDKSLFDRVCRRIILLFGSVGIFSIPITVLAETPDVPTVIVETKYLVSQEIELQEEVRTGSTSKKKRQEYIYETEQPKAYKVQVYGERDIQLEQVQEIEPNAFLDGNIIQVGIFSDRDNAENLVAKLALKGLWSRIVGIE